MAHVAASLLQSAAPSAELELHNVGNGIVNLVARVRGNGAGRRIILNGHLDTYPINAALPWTVDPLGGEIRGGRIYGRGAADMKGGVAASISALAALAAVREHWPGEAVLTLAGDEETMGVFGSQWLIKNVPHARGDAVIIGDAGSPLVLQFGEKGFVWLQIMASGKASHGAHVHVGINAIDRLRQALDAVCGLANLPFAAPEKVTRAIAAALVASNEPNGSGEADVIGKITINVGKIEGGTSMNLMPVTAAADVDIRLPAGLPAGRMEAAIAAATGAFAGVKCSVLRSVEPSVTKPTSPIVLLTAGAANEVMGRPPAVNMRIGASDARLFRHLGIPTVVYGPRPFNMGAADENVLVSDLEIVARVHALASFDFLTKIGAAPCAKESN